MSPETLNIKIKRHNVPSLFSQCFSHLSAGPHEEEGDEEGEDGEHIYDVHSVLEEGPLVGGTRQADEVLQGEPGDAHRLDHCQGRVIDCVSRSVLSTQI